MTLQHSGGRQIPAHFNAMRLLPSRHAPEHGPFTAQYPYPAAQRRQASFFFTTADRQALPLSA